MAANGNPSMISSPSSISNGPEPSQLPPYPPPLRSDQVLQPLSVFPGIENIEININFPRFIFIFIFSDLFRSFFGASNLCLVYFYFGFDQHSK